MIFSLICIKRESFEGLFLRQRPSVLDRLKRPDVRMSDVRSVLLEVDLAPLKRRKIVKGRTSGRDELELLEHRERGQLHVRSSVRSMSERSERISSVLGIEIVPG